MMHGVLNVYKEKGYTSHDVVARLRRITGQKKIGHTGTLDPDAQGVLPVCLGKATKLSGMLTDRDKCYETVLLLGVETDTQDSSGRAVSRKDLTGIGEAEARRAVESFIGGYDQLPPMYSAVKVGGKRLYELAREGKVVPRAPRRVEIYDIRILSVKLPRIRMSVYCSKGTYIRTLCHDIGQRLGCGACMEELVRTKSGPFLLKDSLTLAQIEDKKETGTLGRELIPIDQMFSDYRKGIVKKEWEKCACNGGALPADAVMTDAAPENQGQFRIYGGGGGFIGIYQYDGSAGQFTVVKMFYMEEERQ